MAEAVRAFAVNTAEKVSFITPRGLVNTGNMCYMNSVSVDNLLNDEEVTNAEQVLQTLAFCIPFYDFIDLVGKRAAHSFKSDTPLLDAMILFLREYPIIDSAPSVDQLRMRLKNEELEQFGDAFTPANVYDAIKQIARFSSMRRGHQQDAEEFLIFFLEQLHDECVTVINSLPISALDAAEPLSPASERSSVTDAGWQEVGPKQKASITHTSGHTYNDTPITKIFGGTLRSELRVPGKKNSVTFQPYQPLQLDIGAPEVHNIVDALKGLTRSETIHGDFNSPRGPDVAATKQIFIETLPPVLILHLKRFEYNNMGGTQKIWKKVGYPLELTIPKEVFPQQKRGQISISGLPKYRLEGVIYHHGKNASSGHYTVDLRRQEGREWIRVDDTIIRRLRPEDVAEGGAEEDPKVLAKALEEHKKDSNGGSKNLFDQFGAVEEDAQSDGGAWNTAGSRESGAKKWGAVANANGTATPNSQGAKTPRKENVKDNKVAYILFYRRI
jgi:ubiquitin carboxyl-terminal hydrolase 10